MIIGFDKVDGAVVKAVDGLINVFGAVVVDRLLAVADVKFPFACASIRATSGDAVSNENDERLGVTVVVCVDIELFVETKGIFVVAVVIVLLLFTDVILLDIDDDVSYYYKIY